MLDLKSLSVSDILTIHARLGEELRNRGIVRGANNPTGDLAEYLFCRAFGWHQASNSMRGFDATGPDGTRFQIKGRRVQPRDKTRQLSAIRDLSGSHFDVLAAVLFDNGCKVMWAILIPRTVVEKRSTYRAHTNSHIFLLRDDTWLVPGIQDVTDEVAAAMP